jgi:hypothetical protein
MDSLRQDPMTGSVDVTAAIRAFVRSNENGWSWSRGGTGAVRKYIDPSTLLQECCQGGGAVIISGRR